MARARHVPDTAGPRRDTGRRPPHEPRPPAETRGAGEDRAPSPVEQSSALALAGVLKLQQSAGNAAVAALMRRRPGTAAAEKPPRLEPRSKPVPARKPAPPGAGSTIAAGAPRPTAAPQPTIAGPPVRPAPAAAAPPALEDGGGPAEGPAEAPGPGLGDEELAALDQSAQPEAVQAEASSGPVVQTTPDDEPAEAPDLAAAQGEIAADAQVELEAVGAEGGGEGEATGGGGGGGGSAALEVKPEPPPPDVAQAPPEQAVARLGSLTPGQMAATLGGVGAAAAGAVAREQTRLAAAPPQHTPLAGATAAAPASGLVPPNGAANQARVAAARAGTPRPVPPPRPLPASGPAPASRVPAPALPSAPEGGLSAEGARDLANSIDRLPVRDAGTQLTPGPTPRLRLSGDADPGRVAAQQAHLMQGAAHAQAEGSRDAAEPLGEDAVVPTVPVETMRTEVPGGGGAPAGAPSAAGGGEEVDTAVSVIADEQQGPQLRAAAAAASAAMAAERQRHAQQEHQQRQQSAEQIAALERQHAEAQQTERAGVRSEAAGQRAQWRAEQSALVAGAHAEAGAVATTAAQTVEDERQRADAEAAQHHEQGAQEAAQARQEGEREAARQRAEAKQDSGGGGFLGWIASKAQALFDKVKQGIAAAFERARQAVRAAIEKAQQLATAVIEKARQVAVAAIRAAGSALMAIGDRLLAGFPALRDKFRNAIREAVRRAEAAVNRLAEGLKAGVKAALGLLGRGLTALLSGLEAGLKAVVDGVAATVRGAIQAARAALEMLGAFMAIAKDVAADPGGWLRNLGAAVLDGIRNHLWAALKVAIQRWFNDKVEQVLGLGRAVWNLLTRGGISLAQVGKMAWEGIKQAIPPALIAILIEKLASMIVPGAGAVLAIIQGLQAAWGAVSRILQAIDRFIAFLRAVKSGNGGPAFATAVAAAAVAVIDFVSNFLLARLARGAAKIGAKIRAIAQRIGKALRRVMKRVGGALKRFGKRLGDKFRGLRDRFRKWREKRRRETPEDRRRRLEDRLEKAVAAIKPQAARMLAKGTTPLLFKLRLAWWKLRYRLSALTMDGGGRITARLNPTLALDHPEGRKVTEAELGALLTPIFAAAELEFRRSAAVRTPERAAAAAKWRQGQENALGDPALSRAEKQDILRRNRPGAASMRGEEASVNLPEKSYDSWRVGRVGVVPGPGHYETMAARLRARASGFGLSEADLAAALSTSEVQQADLLGRMTLRPNALKARLAFVRSLRRVSFLVHVVEPARRTGHSVSAAVAFSLFGAGHANLEQVISGSMAPMAPVGAASQLDTKQAREAFALGTRRVGTIFSTLLQVTKKKPPLVSKSGADLSGLAEAVRAWLAQQLAAKPDPEALAAARGELIAGIIRVLTVYYGRST